MSVPPRVLEDEVMDTEEEAREYDAMDHTAVNRRFCEDLLAHAADPSHVVDVGTGTARIPIELCRMHGKVHVIATDLAKHMLARAKENVRTAGLEGRIELKLVDAKKATLPRGAFDVVMSNSIVHHIPKPIDALVAMEKLRKPGGLLFVRDLERPADEATLQRLVATYAANDTPKQRALFEASLRAALTLDEVAAIVAPIGIPKAAIARTSDRHWTIAHRC